MSKHFNYRWYSYDVLVGCQKCGNKIPFQGINGQPTCDDCGYEMKMSWPDILSHLDVQDIKKDGKEANRRTIMGTVNGNVATSWVEGVPCQHCKKTIVVKADTLPEDITCTHCQKPSPGVSTDGINDLAFYKSGVSNGANAGTADMVAVRCASCGAPLNADPTRNNYHCQFCNTENILPPSMRRKVVLDDMYVGVQVPRIPPDVALTAQYIEQVRKALNENKKSDYTDEQLNTIMQKFPNDLGLLNIIRHQYKYNVPSSIYEYLWNNTKNFPVLAEAGRALKKDFAEIEKKGEGMIGKPQKQQAKANPKKTTKKRNKVFWVVMGLLAFGLYITWQVLRNAGML